MTRAAAATWGFVLAGLVIGGIGGQRRFERVWDPRSQCESCHADAEQLIRSGAAPPHTADYFTVCHSCHIFGTQEYLNEAFATVGLAAPAWVDRIEDPVIGGQTCRGCHEQVGRPEIDCALCHETGSQQVRQISNCTSCHEGKTPLHPHHESACEACHLETIADPRGMAKMLMTDSEATRELARGAGVRRAGTTMKTKDLTPFVDGDEERP